MYLSQTIYPIGLASTNVAFGWLLYQLSAPALGALLVVTGLCVILALIEGTVSKLGIRRRNAT